MREDSSLERPASIGAALGLTAVQAFPIELSYSEGRAARH